MKVAKKPAVRCQSMWQWKAQTRATMVSEAFYRRLGPGALIWIVRLEAIDKVSISIYLDGVPAYRSPRSPVGSATVPARQGGGALHHLKVVAMHVNRVATRIIVVDYHLHYVIVVHDLSVRVFPINITIGSCAPYAQSSV